jgi:tagatose-6-phosphate ketose/aldose isomerase
MDHHPATNGTTAATGLDARLSGPVDGWIAALAAETRDVGRLLAASADEQERVGSRHTLREIAQQPVTWVETATRVAARAAELARALAALNADGGVGSLVLTGSGSSLYAGECLAPALQATLRVPVRAVSAGELLMQPGAFLPARGPCLLVSFGRSGNSPESCGAVDAVREAAPECRHLLVTCNAQGGLATRYRDDPRVSCLLLDDKTNDRSLVMTSSFTNMVLAARLLGMSGDVASYLSYGATVARAGARVLLRHSDALAAIGRGAYGSAVYLGSGSRYGSAREAALKMLEMTDGRVKTFAETYLGLRHGPMCAVDDDAVVVCFLSSDPVIPGLRDRPGAGAVAQGAGRRPGRRGTRRPRRPFLGTGRGGGGARARGPRRRRRAAGGRAGGPARSLLPLPVAGAAPRHALGRRRHQPRGRRLRPPPPELITRPRRPA